MNRIARSLVRIFSDVPTADTIPADSIYNFSHTFALMAYVLLVMSVAFGVLLSMRWVGRSVRRETLTNAHMVISIMAIAAMVVHATIFLIVPFWEIHLGNLVIPFIGGTDSLGVGFGVLGLEAVIVVALTILIQRMLGYRRWLVIHRLAYVALGLVWLHVIVLEAQQAVSTAVAISLTGVLAAVLVFSFVILWARYTGNVPGASIPAGPVAAPGSSAGVRADVVDQLPLRSARVSDRAAHRQTRVTLRRIRKDDFGSKEDRSKPHTRSDGDEPIGDRPAEAPKPGTFRRRLGIRRERPR